MELRKLILLALLFYSLVAHSQSASSIEIKARSFLNVADSVMLTQAEELILPDQFKSLILPPVVDNSTLPFLRPVFNQTGASCGQASGVAYNFTYEMCRERNVSAALPENQFPSHFAYNFMNYDGYYGVNYMHSFEILRTLGTPTVQDYGGIAIDDGRIWITGYDKYYKAMQNRVRSVKRIDVGTPEGLLTLKHWLSHHLEGAATGGVANFNAASPWNLVNLPAGTPEAGKKVMAQFPGTYATHAMTIVGYNDSIRYDYNNDGSYTNNIDINGDGVVDMHDWEIGGLKVVNSYGSSWGDEGFYYMMYKLCADDIYYGGIWNHTVNILDVKEVYLPKLTIKLSLKHDRRELIRIVAGISTDTTASIPEHLLYFPVFNYQGGPQYMQGNTSDESHKTIEIGLDITPLLSYLDANQKADFYLEIHETDPQSLGSGEIISYALMDYNQANAAEVVYPQQNIPLINSDITRLKIRHHPEFEEVNITSTQIPNFNAGFQFEASGGIQPYQWNLLTPYHQQILDTDFPTIEAEHIDLIGPNMKYGYKKLDFDFPFYGESFDEVYVHKDGFIMFEPEIYPWPYYKDTYLLFRSAKNISAFLFTPIRYYPGTKQQEGIWYEGNQNYAAFRWKQPLTYYDETLGYGEFALKLFPDGNIEFYYNDILVDENILYYSGVSAGENTEFQLVKGSNKPSLPLDKAIRLVPEKIPSGISMSTEGFLSGIAANPEQISNLSVKVIDDRGISDQKVFQLSNELRFEYELQTQDGLPVHNGSSVWINMMLKNITDQQITAANAILSANDIHIQIIDNQATFGTIPANSSVNISQAFAFSISDNCPDLNTIIAQLDIQSNLGLRKGMLSLMVKAPSVSLDNWHVSDNDNFRFDPGEEAPLEIILGNSGSLVSNNTNATLICNDPYITIQSPSQLFFGTMLPGAKIAKNYIVSVSDQCPIGYEAHFELYINDSDGNYWEEYFIAKIGQIPLLVYNNAKNDMSVSAILQVLDSLEVAYVNVPELPENLGDYRSIIVCLGTLYTSNSLGQARGQALANYLDQGGKLYMEGTPTWYYETPTAVHQKFNVVGSVVSPPIALTSVIGMENTFTQGLAFPFTGTYPLLFIEIEAINTAFPLMYTDAGEAMHVMIGFENSTYKTIANALEFGSFGEPEAINDRKILLANILDFFGLDHSTVSIHESEPYALNESELSAVPNPFSDEVLITGNWMDENKVEVIIYNVNGEKIRTIKTTLFDDNGELKIVWNGKNELGVVVNPGIYFANFKSGSRNSALKIVKFK